jgi:hypothetical protein
MYYAFEGFIGRCFLSTWKMEGNKMKIKFTSIYEQEQIEQPKPAIQVLPEWYKEMNSYIGEEKKPDGEGKSPATIKRCVPVLDAIGAGYLITTVADVYVSQKDGAPWYEWSGYGMIEFHNQLQAPTHPANNGFAYPKFINPWCVETPKGYSTLFVQPFHRDSPFTILPGIVDTDKYTSPVNFPFVLNDPSFEGMIPSGTPIAQVIPFKRDSWKMSFGALPEIKKHHLIFKKIQTMFFDKYKNMYWSRKDFR